MVYKFREWHRSAAARVLLQDTGCIANLLHQGDVFLLHSWVPKQFRKWTVLDVSLAGLMLYPQVEPDVGPPSMCVFVIKKLLGFKLARVKTI